MKNLLYKAKETNSLDKTELIKLLNCTDKEINTELFSIANEIRKKHIGSEVYLRALIEFSNTCQKDCHYCGLRCSNKSIQRYNLTPDDILNCVENAINLKFKTIVLQSGENEAYSTKKLITLIKEIKKYNVALTLSIGEKTNEDYKAYKDAGADRFLLRIETTDEKLYTQLHPNSSLKNRINCIKTIKKLGYELGTGSLVGLPNQTTDSLADDILFFKEMNADMIGIGPFISHNQTPLKDEPNGDFTQALKVMALTRILMPEINIPATTAMETLIKDGQKQALQSGANVVMINLTPQTNKKHYDIYPNKTSYDLEHIKKQLIQNGWDVEMNRGNSLKWEKENFKED